MKPLSLRYTLIFVTLAALTLLVGGLWVFSGSGGHSASVSSFASKEAKSSSGTAPAAAPQQTIPNSAPVPAEEALSQRVVEYPSHQDVSR